MRSRPIRAASTAAALVLLAGAGCSAASPDPGPTSAPATASTVAAQAPAATTPIPTPTPTWPIVMALPTPPPEMSRDDEAGAVAAAEYFLTELYPYTVAGQDTAQWVAMSHSLCAYCAGIVDAVKAQRDAGVATHPGSISVVRQSTEVLSPSAYGVRLELAIGRDLQLSRNGDVLDDRAPKVVTMGAVVVWQVDRWLIRGVDVFVDGAPK